MPTVTTLLPISYEARGIVREGRVARNYVVTEAVPVTLEAIDEIDGTVEMADLTCTIAGRRPWMPVFDCGGRRLEDERDLASWSKAQASTHTYYTWFLSPIRTGGKGAGIDATQLRITVPYGSEIDDRFKEVEWTDRDDVVAEVSRSRLAFVRGVPMTDRYEPVQVDKRTRRHLPGKSLVVDIEDVGSADRELVTPPLDGPFAGRIDWQLDPYASYAAAIGRRLRGRLGSGKSVAKLERFMGADALAAAATCMHAERCLKERLPVSVDRARLEGVLARLERMTHAVENPRMTRLADEVADDLSTVRRTLYDFDKAMSQVSDLDEEAIRTLSF